MSNLHHVHFIIDGEKYRSSSGETYPTYSNVGEPKSIVESASYEDAVKAIESAHAAQPEWEKVPLEDKRDILLKASDILITPKYLEAFVDILLSEKSTTEAGAKREVFVARALLKGYTSKYSQLVGETLPSRVSNGTVFIQRRALGVILAMAPWNAPLMLAMRAIAIPVLCGNTIVFRSSELAPRSVELLIEIFHEAGLPNGVVNLIHIAGEKNPELVPNIIAHPLIRLVSFTGGTHVGRIIAVKAARSLKPVILELGGQGAMIVLNDANVKEAARSIVSAAYASSGQICVSTSRVIVQREVSEELVSEITEMVKKLKAGSAPDSHLPALRTAKFAERIVNSIQSAQDSGAQVLNGDVKHDGPVLQPHLLLGVTPEMNIWKEEIFGPALGIAVCDTIDEAINLANNSEYNLSAGLWTRSLKAMEWASRIRVGWVMVNGGSSHIEFSTELAGLGGGSGWGAYDIDNLTQKRAIILLPEDSYKPLVDDLKL
ncbi:hypothetical protein Clacol_004067 [Clathrus columnatus]|uniref:Aldehyde dehydrogenase domain-containing protein n=1 Tax=Clathrus columnatus TaxID=1419009 RepID=A0AAV5A8Q6_9AGAM|nr:hypothetical protein Clacol_004067 [Clathrus columnatus]